MSTFHVLPDTWPHPNDLAWVEGVAPCRVLRRHDDGTYEVRVAFPQPPTTYRVGRERLEPRMRPALTLDRVQVDLSRAQLALIRVALAHTLAADRRTSLILARTRQEIDAFLTLFPDQPANRAE